MTATRPRFRAVLLLLLLTASPLAAQVHEQGSLRAFLLGSEPNAAYDNWLSHTVEGLATDDGYNHYIPAALDRQTNGFGQFMLIPESEDSSAHATWRGIFNAFLSGNMPLTQGRIDAADIPYQVVIFDDNETGNTYYMLRELLDQGFVDDNGTPDDTTDDVTGSFRRGWGVYIINPSASLAPVMAQVPHPNDDFIATPIAVQLLLSGDLGGLAVTGAGREVLWDGAHYNNGSSLSDPTRMPRHPFNYFTEAWVHTLRELGMHDLIVQIHSYDSDSHENAKPVQVSCGQVDGNPNRPCFDRSLYGHDWINFAPRVAVPADQVVLGQEEVLIENYFAVWNASGLVHLADGVQISNWVDLPGFPDNVPMQLAGEGANSVASLDHFLHVEFDELPGAIEDAGVGEAQLYGGNIPPSPLNWGLMLSYYDTAITSLAACLDDMYHGEDSLPPATPGAPGSLYSSDRFADLSWYPAPDPNFATYEIYYDTTATVDESSPYVDSRFDPALAGMMTTSTRLQPLVPDHEYTVRFRAVDLMGNTSELSDPVTVTSVDTTAPELDYPITISSYPLEAWPPRFSCSVRSIEPLERVAALLSINGGPETALDLVPVNPWHEGSLTRYAFAGTGPTPQVQAGDRVAYRYMTRDVSLHTPEVYYPGDGAMAMMVHEGRHIFDAPLEANDGGFAASGEPRWHWGTPAAGPEAGFDGEHAWAVLDPQADTEAELRIPYPLPVGGNDHTFLVFQHWYNTEPAEGANRTLCGGTVEASVDSGQTWSRINPLGSYPTRYPTSPYVSLPSYGLDSDGWQQAVFRLDGFAGYPSVMLRFVLHTVGRVEGSTGWVIDNVRVTSQTPVLPAPEGLAITTVGSRSIRLTWRTNGANLYRIYRGTDPYGPMEMVAETPGSSWIDTGVIPGEAERYYYRVTAVLQ